MQPEDIMASEISQTVKDKYYMMTLFLVEVSDSFPQR